MIRLCILAFLYLGQLAAQQTLAPIFPVILEPQHRTEVYAEVYTRVIQVPKQLGDVIEKDDLLIQLDNDLFKANVNKAEKIVEKAEAELEVKKELYAQNLLSLLELKESEANLATAQAELVLAQKNLQSSEIRAAYRGRIANVGIRPFELPEHEKPMLEYIDDQILLAKFLIPSQLLNKINLGDPVYFLIQDKEEIVAAKISRIGPTINPVSGTVKVEAKIDNSRGLWKSGMTTFASFSKEDLLAQDPFAFEVK